MSTINILLVAIGSLLTFIWYKFTKPSGINNDKTTQQINNLQSQIDSNNTSIKQEEAKRTQIDKDGENEKAKDTTLDTDADFLNKNTSK